MIGAFRLGVIAAAGGAGGAGPSPGPSDPYWSSVSALLHFDGADGSTSFVDEKGRTWTRYGSARISTAQSKFGGASYTPFAASSSIQTPFAVMIGAADDFTIEFWFRPSQVSSGKTILDIRTSATNRGLLISQPGADPSSINFYCGDSNSSAMEVSLNSGAASISPGGWYHVAAVRAINDYFLFLNGALVASSNYAGLSIDYGPTLSFGNNIGNSASVWVDGFLDELRITAGIARYTSAFTPPAAPFPNFGSL